MRKGIQLAYPFEERRLARWKPPFIIQPKLDGDRCRCVIDHTGKVTMLSSEENEILSVPHISFALHHSGLHDIELDGELYVHGMCHEDIHGIVSRTSNLHARYEDMELHIFDVVSDDPQIERITTLLGLSLPQNVHPVHNLIAMSLDDVMNAFGEYVDQGYEGIIVRDSFAPYVRKRSTQMMKFKPKKSDIYEILGAVEEVSIYNEPKGTLGALICKAPDTDEQFNVGTGFDAEERRALWQQRHLLPGQLVRVAYQHVTSGRGVPRFPVFVEILWMKGGEQDVL